MEIDIKSNKKILFLDILTGDIVIREKINNLIYNGGTYGDDVRNVIGVDKKYFECVDASLGIFPDTDKYGAVIIGGSMEDPIKGTEKEWVIKTYDFIRQVKNKQVPILGICGGLQFTTRAFGGEVVCNPKGRNFGKNIINITKEGLSDKLFEDIPLVFETYSSHQYVAISTPKEWKCLAFSEKTPIEVLAIGNSIRLVQFHPEMTQKIIKKLALFRKEVLIKDGYFGEHDFDLFLQTLNIDNYFGKKILNNFIKNFTNIKRDLV